MVILIVRYDWYNTYYHQHLCDKFYDLSAWDGYCFLVSMWRIKCLSFWLHNRGGKWEGWAP